MSGNPVMSSTVVGCHGRISVTIHLSFHGAVDAASIEHAVAMVHAAATKAIAESRPPPEFESLTFHGYSPSECGPAGETMVRAFLDAMERDPAARETLRNLVK